MKRIQLTQGKVALVDDEDFEELNKYKWCVRKYRKTFYVCRSDGKICNKRVFLRMHRVIINTSEEMQIDHIDGDGMNNQKYNLRICTASQNCMNRKKRVDNTSGYKGVSKSGERWRAIIWVNRKQIHLGYFINKLDAYKEYCEAAEKYHKEFAHF